MKLLCLQGITSGGTSDEISSKENFSNSFSNLQAREEINPQI
jgi:hypothetical protein